jgi:hypothetical protein
MSELTEATRNHVATLFRESEVAEAERLLVSECGENLPFMSEATPQALERLRFAAIRLSGGQLDRLQQAVKLAQVDWRDLLVAAGFAENLGAHLKWMPRPFNSDLAALWSRGELVEGVSYALNDEVLISDGLHRQGKGFRNSQGVVVALVGLEPVPRYLVRMAGEHTVEISESMLRRAG